MKDKKEIQYLWDLNLLSCWKRDLSVIVMVYRFLRSVGHKDLDNEKLSDLIEAISNMNLKRCHNYKHEGKTAFVIRREMPVRAYVASCSE